MANDQVAELTDENKALFEQLHLVQEELERLHNESRQSDVPGASLKLQWVDDELPGILAENQRLQLVIDTQKRMLEAESNSLAGRLGRILVQHMRSPGSLVTLPGKLWKFWREVHQKNPPRALGGKMFSAVIKTCEQSGMEAVGALLDTVDISSVMRANAYTALARHLMQHDAVMAAEAAQRAFETDPRPYRFKWLIFRLYDAGAVCEAEAMLDLLPLDISLSASEARQAERVRLEAKQIREGRAYRQGDYELRKKNMEKYVHELIQARDQANALANERAVEIERLLANGRRCGVDQVARLDVISVIGLGYIGLPTASLLASRGKRVDGVDVNPHIVSKVNAGESHFVEPELDALIRDVVSRGLLRASVEIAPADAFIIAVPTPLREGHKPDVTYIEAVAQALAPVLARGNLIILESTSPVGTTEKLARWLADARPDLTFPQQAGSDADIHLAFCPERVLPGKILHELAANDRVIGGMSVRASELAESLYRIFVAGDIVHTDPRTAELCKLAENSFRDVNIAFANELSMLCDKMGVDVWKVRAFANRHPRVNILEPGTGVGGHCIAVDPWFIVDSAPEQARLIRTARTVNDHKPEWVLEKIQSAVHGVCAGWPGKAMADVTVACLGLAFKPDTDDLRESPAMRLVRDIASLGCQVLAVEPCLDALPPSLAAHNVRLVPLEEAVAKADILSVLVRHSLFGKASADILRHGKVIDAVGLLHGPK